MPTRWLRLAFRRGHTFSLADDSQGRIARQERDGGAEFLTFSYDVNSYRVRDALGNLTDFFYDDTGRVRTAVDGLGRTIHTAYDEDRLPAAVLAPDGSSTTFSYDSSGNVRQSVDPLGQLLVFDHDPIFNRLVGWNDAFGRSTDFGIDANGNQLSTTYPDGTVDEFAYDAQGNLVRALNRRGQLVALHL